jgi:hypothetical protein
MDLNWLQTWYLTPGKKRRLRVVENGVLRKTVGAKWNKEAGD